MVTESQINANRANAQHSSGPSSPEGKLKSSHNALKTGLTGRTILLPTDDAAAYENFVEILKRKYQPYDAYEKHLVQSIADTEWRLLRIPTLESGYYALGRHELAAECAHEPNEQVRAAMLEAFIDRSYKRTSATSPCRNAAYAGNSPSSSLNSPNCRKNAKPFSSSVATES